MIENIVDTTDATLAIELLASTRGSFNKGLWSRRRRTVMRALVLTASVVALLVVPRANATIEIRLINTAGGGDTGWVTSATNMVSFNGAVGNYDINVSTSIADNGINPFLDLNSVDHTSVANAGVLIIETIATGYTANAPGFFLSVGGTNNLGGAADFAGAGGNVNTNCAAGVNACSAASLGFATIGSLSFVSTPFSGSNATAVGSTVNPYALGILAAINGQTAGSVSFDAAIDAVPEPASVLLFGAVLLLSATLLRKKLRKV